MVFTPCFHFLFYFGVGWPTKFGNANVGTHGDPVITPCAYVMNWGLAQSQVPAPIVL